MNQCKIKFLQGEDLEVNSSLEAKDLLEILSNLKFTVVYDNEKKTIIVNTDNINSVELTKGPAVVEVGQGVPRKGAHKRPEVMSRGK
jgi:hypothetical protein